MPQAVAMELAGLFSSVRDSSVTMLGAGRSSKMKILLVGVALSVLLSTCIAGVEVVEIGNVQVSRTLSGTVIDLANSPIADVQVIEVAADWKTIVRSTTTNAQGQWSLPPVSTHRIYYLRLVKQNFNEVRFRVKLNKQKGEELRITLPVST